MAVKKIDAGQDTQLKISDALERALTIAESNFIQGKMDGYNLSTKLCEAITEISRLSQKASTGFTNIVTCLAIKSALPSVDMRYHQVQIQNQTNRPAGFNFRGISENVIYPWLSEHTFEGAKSGWQTRTFERPKPYMLTYDENIGDIKSSFLCTFDEIEVHNQSAEVALTYLIHLQLILRESKKIVLSIPRTKDILLIVKVLKDHFFHPYKASKGASRLPVLALYAIYSVLIEQLDRYKGMELKTLEEHSAADSQTGAIGDIEVILSGTDEVFEAIEVKHDIPLSERIINDATKKIMDKSVDRYYVLTTHATCEPDDELNQKIAKIKQLYNCQFIANGVIPSLKYYLRLLSDPSLVLPRYVELLASDKSIKHEHRQIWNELSISG
jgi:DNA (cytosine-5)-methyltransferase 1